MSADIRSFPPLSPPSAGVRARWRQALLLLGLMALGLGLRLFQLDYVDFRQDETISVFAARASSAAEIYRSIGFNDTHPPGYHILLHYWGALFSYELVPLRLFSVTTSLLCIPAVYLLGRKLLGPHVGVLAAGLMTVSPFQIFYTNQIRMYPLLTLVVLATTLAFVTAWRRGGAWRWALVGLTATMGLYTHFYFALSLLGLNLWALAESISQRRLNRRAWAGLISSQLVAVALFAPFLSTTLGITRGVIDDFWIAYSTPFDWINALVEMLSFPTRLGTGAPAWLLLLVFVPSVTAVLLPLLYAGAALRKGDQEREVWALLLFTILTPCLIATAVSMSVRPLLVSRYLIGVSGPLFILIAGVVSRTWRRRSTPPLSAMSAIAVVIGLVVAYPHERIPHTVQPPLDRLFAERKPDEAIVVLDWQTFDRLAMRYPEAEDVYVGSPAADIGYWQRRMDFMRWHARENVGPLALYAAAYQRIWVVRTTYSYPRPLAEVRTWAEQHGRLLRTITVGLSPQEHPHVPTYLELYEVLP